MVQRKATIYMDGELHRALKLKAAETERTLSEIVSEAVRRDLAEDAVDLAAFEDRQDEPDLPFADVVKQLRRDGKI